MTTEETETLKHFDICLNFWDDRATLDCNLCHPTKELALDATGSDTLADVVRRAIDHAEKEHS